MRSKVKDRIILRGGRAAAANFLPSYLPNLKLWLDASTDAITDGAAQFTSANSEYLSIADNASLSTGDVDFWCAGWVYLDSKTVTRSVIGKNNGATAVGSEYLLNYTQSSDRFSFYVYSSSSTFSISADALGVPSTGAWYFLLAWHDATSNTINIRVNNGTVDSAAHTLGANDTATDFNIGSVSNATQLHDGRLDSVAFGKSPPGGIAGIISALSTALYNSGVGKTYADLTTAQKTDWGLISWWDLDEQSGTRNDSHGTNHLTDNNTVTSAIGIVAGIATDGDPISKWTDRSGIANHALQATAAKRPTFKTNILNGKPVIRLDGTDDCLQIPSFALKTFCTVFVVGKFTTTSGYMFFEHSVDATTNEGLQFYGDIYGWAFNRSGSRHYCDGVTNWMGTNFVLAELTYDGSGKYYKNTTLQANNAITGTARADTLATAALNIGSRNQASIFSNGDFAEIIIYEGALSDSQRAQVEAYLNTKYAIY